MKNFTERIIELRDSLFGMSLTTVVIEAVKSKVAKELHQEGMYSENEVLLLCKSAHEIGAAWGDMEVSSEAKEAFENWFKESKKKVEL